LMELRSVVSMHGVDAVWSWLSANRSHFVGLFTQTTCRVDVGPRMVTAVG
jgi:hypothetical protein